MPIAPVCALHCQRKRSPCHGVRDTTIDGDHRAALLRHSGYQFDHAAEGEQTMRMLSRGLIALTMVGALVAAGCSSDTKVDTNKAEQQVKEASGDLRKSATEAWAGLSTDGDRLVDRVQTLNDADAKKELLNKCRAAQERLKKDNNQNADRTNTLCDRIRDADVNNATSWNDIKTELRSLSNEFRSQ